MQRYEMTVPYRLAPSWNQAGWVLSSERTRHFVAIRLRARPRRVKWSRVFMTAFATENVSVNACRFRRLDVELASGPRK